MGPVTSGRVWGFLSHRVRKELPEHPLPSPPPRLWQALEEKRAAEARHQREYRQLAAEVGWEGWELLLVGTGAAKCTVNLFSPLAADPGKVVRAEAASAGEEPDC